MESAVANLCSPGQRVVVVSAGNFGERWVELTERYGAEVTPLRYEWGETPSPDDVRERAAGAKYATLVHSETSTGVVADVQALAAAAKEAGVRRLLLTDFSARYSRDSADLEREAKSVFSEVLLGRDGMEIDVPFRDAESTV